MMAVKKKKAVEENEEQNSSEEVKVEQEVADLPPEPEIKRPEPVSVKTKRIWAH